MLERWQRYRKGTPCPICGKVCKGWLHKNREGAFCSKLGEGQPTDYNGLKVWYHKFTEEGQVATQPIPLSSISVKPLPKNPISGMSLISSYGSMPIEKAQLLAYQESTGKSWPGDFDDERVKQFNYMGKRSKEEKLLFEKVSGVKP